MTPADIQRVARRWLRDEASSAVRYLPEEARNGATGDTIATAATVAAAPLATPAHVRLIEPAPASAARRAAAAGAGDRAAGADARTSSGSPTGSP